MLIARATSRLSTASLSSKKLKSFDTPSDYTYYHSDEENKKDCEDIVNISHFMKEQCVLYDLPYFETSHNREVVLNGFISHCLEN
jgi:hypothetical protein